MSQIPAELQYTAEHEWVRIGDDGTITVGVTDFAQDSLGDVVFVELPEVGGMVSAGESCGEIESTKSVSALVAPLTGTVTAINESLDSAPELVNSAPYGDGWLYTIAASDASEQHALLSAETYQSLLD